MYENIDDQWVQSYSWENFFNNNQSQFAFTHDGKSLICAQHEQMQGNAQAFLNKAKLAEESVSRIQSKLSAVANALSQSATLTPENKARLQTSVQDALQTMQNELSSQTTDGGYLFASSADPNQVPISDIVNGIHYNADGTSNTSYVINPSSSNKVTAADGVSVNVDFNPADQSISDSIAALQMMRDDLAQNAPSIRTAARTLFQTAQSELANFLGNDIKVRFETVSNAMETNNEIQDQINQLLESEYASDPISIAATLANLETVMLSNLNMLAKIINTPKIWDLIIV